MILQDANKMVEVAQNDVKVALVKAIQELGSVGLLVRSVKIAVADPAKTPADSPLYVESVSFDVRI